MKVIKNPSDVKSLGISIELDISIRALKRVRKTIRTQNVTITDRVDRCTKIIDEAIAACPIGFVSTYRKDLLLKNVRP